MECVCGGGEEEERVVTEWSEVKGVMSVVVSVVRERGGHKGREWDIRATILI